MADETPKRPAPIYLNLAVDNSEVDDERGGGDGAPPELIKIVFGSDDFLGKEVTAELTDKWVCVHPGGTWRKWDGVVFRLDETREVLRVARGVCRRIGSELESVQLGRKISALSTINAALKLAAGDAVHAVTENVFDHNDWLLNTPGPLVDLRTGQARDRLRDDFLSRVTRVAPHGDCPLFHAFLMQACDHDKDLMRYLQKVAGYCLTGLTVEHAIFFIYGPSGTGKSVLQDLLAWVMGEYAAAAQMDIFTEQTGERHSSGLAVLEGKRLVVAAETQQGKRWHEGLVKTLSGGDRVSANRMRQDPREFTPKLKLLFVGNYRPAMSADDAMRRRMHVIPFRAKPEVVDKELTAKLRGEGPGILAWMVEGAVLWQREGLKPPAVVVEATQEYFEAENMIGRWVAERCDVHAPDMSTSLRHLYADYVVWAKLVGERFVLSERRFVERLAQSPFVKVKMGKVVTVNGKQVDHRVKGFRGPPLLSQPMELDLEQHRSAPPPPTARGGGGDDEAERWEREGPRD